MEVPVIAAATRTDKSPVAAQSSELSRERKYDIGGVVARGGMGAILAATEAGIERKVAMKVMLDASSPEDRARFIAEAKITGQLEHPNIVPVHELSVNEQGQAFYTMKFVRGTTLRDVLDGLAEGAPRTQELYPLGTLLTIFQKVCDAVAFAHARGVIHRDLKPENIMLGDFGEVLVMDWGLAKLLGKSVQSSVLSAQSGNASAAATENCVLSTEHSSLNTLQGTIMGTPHYMAPEQARGEVETLDQRVDIYALGAILYHVLALRPSVVSDDAREIVMRVGCGDIDPLTAPAVKGRAIPDSLAAVVRKAMEVDPARRYPSVTALQADLAAYQNGFATSAEQAGLGKQLLLLIGRHQMAAAGLAAVLLVGTTFGTRAVVEGRRAEREAFHARQEAQHAMEEAQRAERGEERASREAQRAEGALADLKRQAPGLRELAETGAGLQRFESALDKLDAALGLDPTHLPSYWRRAWLLTGLERWADAAAAVRTAQEKDPAQAQLAAILPLLDHFAAATSESERWTPGAAAELFQHLRTVNASAELARLSAKLKLGTADKIALIKKRLIEWLGPGKGGVGLNLGRIEVNLHPSTTGNQPIETVEPLKGLPIEVLNISSTKVSDVEPLRGMPLQVLDAEETKVADLSPLSQLPLVELDARYAPVTDIAPLQGLPLRVLRLGWTKVSSLAALRGMPLRLLSLQFLEISDLTPLRGAPLQELDITGCANVVKADALAGMPLKILHCEGTKMADLSFLKGAPLVNLWARGTFQDISSLRGTPLRTLLLSSENLTDLSPLRGLPIETLTILANRLPDLTPLLDLALLEKLRVLHSSKALEPLRHHPSLKSIAPGTFAPALPVEQFWADYDAQQAGAAAKK